MAWIILRNNFAFQQNCGRSESTVPELARGYEGPAELRDGKSGARGEVPEGRTRTTGVRVETLQETHRHPRDAQTVQLFIL